jgi:dephospho-CoA kinase
LDSKKLIGITGGIGAGKSLISRVLIALGYPVFNSDDASRLIVNSDLNVIQAIKNEFGEIAYNQGVLNRKLIGELVFNHPEKLNQLNQIIHPAVGKALIDWKDQQDKKILFNEAAILFETGNYKKYDATILVTAPKEVRAMRVMKRDSASAEVVAKRMENQWSDEQKIALADYVITNDDSSFLIPQILEVIKLIER